jgi:antagonist of KipI
MAVVTVVKPGLLTTIQDRGRWGLQSRGVPVAGPMDPCSHRVANALVGNSPDMATLEITLIGPELEFEDERVVAISGAQFLLTVDGVERPANQAFVIPRGGRLRFGQRNRGSRAYVAIAGGIAVPPVMGSRATHLVSRLGGLSGRALTAGDRLPLGEAKMGTGVLVGSHPRKISPSSFSIPDREARVRVLPGPQREYFSADALDVLQSAPYAVGTASDRMGFRLQGPILKHSRGADVISDATPLGVLQVPASGQPVLLMADRQTTGGYPKIATVISADIPIAGQLAPGDVISFEVCTERQAYAALIAQEQALMAIEAAASS